jgi:mono/diheme cytochrome c family protein
MMPRWKILRAATFGLVIFPSLWTAKSQGQDAADLTLARNVQAILARKCFSCHGPDHAEAGLRLDDNASATGLLESGSRAIVPGDLSKSHLMERIVSEDESLRMPPEGKPLGEQERQSIARWIEQGAVWQRHWAFESVAPVEVPARLPGSQSDHPIDAFIDQQLKSAGLERSPRASNPQLLRRLYQDLIGLPPTLEQTVEFEQQVAELGFDAAYESVVDRLLASERFGERWARHWLDVVRYAETNSFERDGRKPHAWRYRDYVIRSFNEDKPYDQFLVEQLAGDELPEVTRDSLIATGFYRLGIWDDEPADRELAMYDGLDDILTTVGQGMLGLTVNCSRCHDHKIDPIPAADYYKLIAFIRNITPNGNGPYTERPLVASESDRQLFQQREKEIRERVDRLQGEINQLEKELREQFTAATSQEADVQDLDDLEFRFYRDTFEKLPDFDQLKPETVGKLPTPRLDIGLATREDHFGFVFSGTLIVPQDGQYIFSLDSDDGSRLSLDGKMLIEYDGIHGVGRPQRTSATLKAGRHPFRVDYFQGRFGKGLQLSWSGPGFKRRSLSVEDKAKNVDLNQLLQSDDSGMLDPQIVARYKLVRKELEEAKRQRPWEEYGLCVSESGINPPETFILTRGLPQAKGEKVEPGVLSILGGEVPQIVPDPQRQTSGRRLALARWIASPGNPLTSRVLVNRLWQHHFGRGIVRSANNFGQLGDPPTHPQLLDWLAGQLINHQWRLKPLHKLMVMSQTYQQSSLASDEAARIDPSNNNFSHFNRRRLSAEELRDGLLATSGQLNLSMYGPSIFPEISREVLAGQSVPGAGWEQSSEKDRARRSIYIHIKRSLMVPLMASFDFPEPDTSCEARFVTTQPGQALGMLNGDFLNEQAERLAGRVSGEVGEDPVKQVRRVVELALLRPATDKEVQRGIDLMAALREQHQLSPSQALQQYCLMICNSNEFIYID